MVFHARRQQLGISMRPHRARLKGYGAVIMTNSDGGGALIGRLRRLIQQEYKWDALDSPIPRGYGPTGKRFERGADRGAHCRIPWRLSSLCLHRPARALTLL